MLNRIAAVSFTLGMLCLSTLARADANLLLGTWQLKSFVREVAGTGERYNQVGDRPDGYISYSPDGRMLVFFVAADQPRPRNEPTYGIDGDTLSLKTEPNKSPVDGREGVGVLTFSRVRASRP